LNGRTHLTKNLHREYHNFRNGKTVFQEELATADEENFPNNKAQVPSTAALLVQYCLMSRLYNHKLGHIHIDFGTLSPG
jgi:hypothetical protein